MCGPACPIECNQPINKSATPHIHPGAQGTFEGAFPLHRMPSLRDGLQQPPARAVTPVDGRRLSSASTLSRPPTLMDGLIQDQARKAARLLNPSQRFEAERRLEQAAFEMTMYGSGAINQMADEDVKPSWKIGRYVPPIRRKSVSSVPLLTRVPSLYPANPDGATASYDIGSNMGIARGETPSASHPTLAHTRSLSQLTSLDGATTPTTERFMEDAQSLRTIPTARARGKLRIVNPSPSVASSGASRPQTVVHTPQRSRYHRTTPIRPPENRPSSPDASGDLTLRHIQRMMTNQVDIRLAMIGERCHHFREVSRYEAVDKEIFTAYKQLQIMKVMLENDNKELGGCEEREEPIWREFLRLLEKVEGDVERENSRLKSGGHRKRVRKEKRGKKANKGEEEEEAEETESCNGSFATARESFTIDSIPAVQTGLVRSLSLPARLPTSSRL